MATVLSKRSRGAKGSEVARHGDASGATGSASANRRRYLRAIVVVGLLVALLVGFAPSMIAISPLRNLPLTTIFAGIDGSINSQSASFGWLSSVRYDGVELRDGQGELVLSIASITSEKTLAGILADIDSPGNLRVESPEVFLHARADGSNAEDVLLPWWNAPSSVTNLTMGIELVDGKVALHDTITQQKWDITDLQSQLVFLPHQGSPVSMSASGKVQAIGPANGGPASFAISQAAAGSVSETPPTNSSTNAPAAIELKSDRLPLDMLRWVAARWYPDLQIAGQLTANLTSKPAVNGDKATVIRGEAGVSNFAMTGGPIGSDTLRLQQLKIPCDIEQSAGELNFKQCAVECEAGQLSVTGRLRLPEKFDRAGLESLLRESFRVEGAVDLAQLARMLPGTLRVRAGTEITSGQVQLSLLSQTVDRSQQWQARVQASKLTGTNAGRPIQWDNPVTLAIVARDTAQGPIVETLSCDSNFLQLTGRGTLDELSADVAFDLNRLVAELGQFVDFGKLQLAGDGRGQLTWKRAADGQFRATGAANVRRFNFATNANDAWREDELTTELVTAGQMNGAELRRLDTLSFKAFGAGAAGQPDAVDVQLKNPVENPLAAKDLRLNARCTGQLAQWRARLSPWVTLTDWDLSGYSDIAVDVSWSPTTTVVHSLRGSVQKLHAWGAGLFIDEPQVEIDLTGQYETATGRMTLGPTSLLSSSLSLKTEAASVSLPTDGPMGLLGQVAYQADLDRLQRWTSDPRVPATIIYAGRLSGQADISLAGQTTAARVDATVDNFVLVSNSKSRAVAQPPLPQALAPPPLWQEKQLSIALDGNYDRVTDIAKLKNLQVTSQALALKAVGQIDALNTLAQLDLAGTVDYDWKTLSRILTPYVGSAVRIEGRESRQFAVRGPVGDLVRPGTKPATQLVSVTTTPSIGAQPAGTPTSSSADSLLWLKPLSANAGLGWKSADLFGMTVGQGELVAKLDGGVLQLDKIDWPVSEGRLRLSPQILLTPAPAEVILNRGLAVDRVRVSPEMTATWLKFIAPAVAEATQTEGTLSVDLAGGKIPLFTPEKGDIGGWLQIHSLEVTPGPTSRALVLLTQQIRAITRRQPPPLELSRDTVLLRMTDQTVDFRMVDGRVYHQGMELAIGDVTVRTTGSVGLDESLSLTAEIPIREDWIGNDPILAGMKGQVLKVPIEGTLRRPRVDQRAVQQLGGMLIENAARGAIENQLNKQLDRLFSK